MPSLGAASFHRAFIMHKAQSPPRLLRTPRTPACCSLGSWAQKVERCQTSWHNESDCSLSAVGYCDAGAGIGDSFVGIGEESSLNLILFGTFGSSQIGVMGLGELLNFDENN